MNESNDSLDNLDKSPSKDKAAGRDKRGALSTVEQDYIRQFSKNKTIAEIAADIRRSTKTVTKFINQQNLVTTEDTTSDAARFIKIRGMLRKRDYWPELQKQFNTQELKTFESSFIKLWIQFDNDVTTSEEFQIKKYITTEILKDRIMKRVQDASVEVEKIKKTTNSERAKRLDDQNLPAIRDLAVSIEGYDKTISDYNKQFLDIIDAQKEVEKSLKVSRDQRVKQIADAGKSFQNVITLLDNPEIRTNVGKHIEIMRIAKEVQKLKLYDYHTFVNGGPDKPILCKESIEIEEKENNKS